MTTKRLALLLVGVCVGGVFLWLTLRQVDVREIKVLLVGQLNPWFALPFLAIYGLFFWLKAIRWRMLLDPVSKTTAWVAFPAIIIGHAGNVIIPAQMGELVRTYVIGRQLNVRKAPILASIVLERVLDLLTILLLLLFALIVSLQDVARFKIVLLVIGAFTLGVTLFVLAYLYRTNRVVAFVQRWTMLLPSHWQRRLLEQVELAAAGLGSIKRAHLFLSTLLMSLAMWATMAICIYITMAAVAIDVPASGAVIVLVATVMGLMLPTSPGFAGTMQFCFLFALTPYGVNVDRAVAASVFYNILVTIPPLLLGGYFLIQLGYSLRELRRGAG